MTIDALGEIYSPPDLLKIQLLPTKKIICQKQELTGRCIGAESCAVGATINSEDGVAGGERGGEWG